MPLELILAAVHRRRHVHMIFLGCSTMLGLWLDLAFFSSLSSHLPTKRFSPSQLLLLRSGSDASPRKALVLRNGSRVHVDDELRRRSSRVLRANTEMHFAHAHENPDSENVPQSLDGVGNARHFRTDQNSGVPWKAIAHLDGIRRRKEFWRAIERRGFNKTNISPQNSLSVHLLASIEPTFTCDIQQRFGQLGDGGKVLCSPQQLLFSPNCLVYSFGSRLDCHFERDVLLRFPHCEVHVFDPQPGLAEKYRKSRCAPGTIFHSLGLGGYKTTKMFGKTVAFLQTLPDIVEQLGHKNREISVLKVDVEGSEYDAFQYMFDMDALPKIGVISIELHLRRLRLAVRSLREQFRRFVAFFERMDADGFMVYHKELNSVWGRGNAEFGLVHKTLVENFKKL